MELGLKMRKLNQQFALWHSEDRVLLAVSGGVDSMVLLNLFLNLPDNERPQIAVAHVNHQLRSESLEEESMLREFCMKRKLPFFCVHWKEGPFIQSNLELQAREFRYQFFEQVMIQENYQILLTAHHADDQAETILMRLTKGAQLASLTGIPLVRDFGIGKIVRPLLGITKRELYEYAAQKKIGYMEDQSNFDDSHFRNRIRQQVMPVLRSENPEVSKQLSYFAERIDYAGQLISEKIKSLIPSVFQTGDDDTEQLNVDAFLELSEPEQYFLLVDWCDRRQKKGDFMINEQQLEQILQILRSSEPQKQIYLQKNRRFVKRYNRAFLAVTDKNRQQAKKQVVDLNQGSYLSEDQWIGIFEPASLPDLTEFEQWHQLEAELFLSSTDWPLSVRKRQPGDTIQIENGHHKKIGRIYIDQKIPLEDRSKSWLLVNKNDQILWCLPYRNSYLSIMQETDKIQYRLIYCYR